MNALETSGLASATGVALALAVGTRADLLVLDEPLADLDPPAHVRVLQWTETAVHLTAAAALTTVAHLTVRRRA